MKEAAVLPERHTYPDVEEEDEDDANDPSDASGAEPHPKRPAKVSFHDFFSRLVLCARVYGEIVLAKTADDRIDRHLRNLRMIKAVQTYGFLMHLRVGGCSDRDFREVLRITESFVLRRHICRERANETEALFARLCGNNPKAPMPSTKQSYLELCPSDEKFKEEFAGANFSANLIDRARYLS